MSGQVMLTLQDLQILAATAERNGTSRNFAEVALQWAAGAQAEIERLRAERGELARWKSTHAPRVAALEGLLPAAQLEAAAGQEARATLQSERQANAMLTDRIETLENELASACAQWSTQKLHDAAEIEQLRAERDHARAQVEYSVRLLVGIHSLLYPAPIKAADGRLMVFRQQEPDARDVLQELSDRIRALPDELARMRARQW